MKKERTSSVFISKLTEPIAKEIKALSALPAYELDPKIYPFIAKVNSADKELKQINTPAAKNARRDLVRDVRSFALDLHHLKNRSTLALQIVQGLFQEFYDLSDMNAQLRRDMQLLNSAVNSKTQTGNDYSINEWLFHWQSQSTTAEKSSTGQRYIHHKEKGSRVLLFVREFKADRITNGAEAYTFLGTANYVKHEGEKPMNITWKLDAPIPAKYLKKTNKLVVG